MFQLVFGVKSEGSINVALSSVSCPYLFSNSSLVNAYEVTGLGRIEMTLHPWFSGMVTDKNNAFGGEKQNKKSNCEQSVLCDLEQITLKPQLQVHNCLTIRLQIRYHILPELFFASTARNWRIKFSSYSEAHKTSPSL